MTLADALIAASALAQRIDAIAVDDTPAVRVTAVDAEAIRVILAALVVPCGTRRGG